MMERARIFAMKSHEGQTRKYSGQPYFSHPELVANILKYMTTDEDLIAAAYLHDVLEDTGVSLQELQRRFGERVAGLVWELTSDSEQIQIMGKAAYLANKMNLMSDEAFLIKLADRLDNLHDLSAADEEFRNRYLHQTREILHSLNRNLTPEQEYLLSKIQAILDVYSE